MRQRFIVPLIMGMSIAMPSLLAASVEESYFSPEDLEVAALNLNQFQETNRNIEKTKNRKSIHAFELNEIIINKLAGPLHEIVTSYDDKDNLAFQARLESLRESAFKFFKKKLPMYGQANRAEEQIEFHFYKIWKDALNFIYEEKAAKIENEDSIIFDDEQDDDQSRSFKTTLLNILIRRSHSLELAHKVQTLIENGADKNLNSFFEISSKMKNQSEYPIRLVLDEIESDQLRYEILSVLFDDTIIYSYNNVFQDYEDELMQPIKKSMQQESNKEYLLKRLIDKRDFVTFSLILDYLEKSNIFVISDYEDKISQIEDQIYSPVLEDILSRMRSLRKNAYTQDKNGTQIDNITEVLNSRHLRKFVNKQNHEERFGQRFVRKLETDFDDVFKDISYKIDVSRSETEIHGEQLKTMIIDWVKWANFRNRIASHLNKYALTASNKAKKSNVIRLIRYANIYKPGHVFSNDDELFKELHEFGGKEIIFTKRNKYGWTPLMYAMAQKQAQGIQLYLRQAPHEITLRDGIDNNILHLAFPLPEQFYRSEIDNSEDNVLQLVGADIGKAGVKEKTAESIKSIIEEESVPKQDKIKALKQLSASNFTPVSLAAAMGFLDTYEYLVDFLKGEGAWNRDDHSHLATHVEELVVLGLKNYLNAKIEDLKDSEIEEIENQIKVREEEIEKIIANSIGEIYDNESQVARQYLEEIIAPARSVLEDYEEQKGTKRARAPYSNALKSSMKVMTNPAYIKVKVYETQPVEKRIAKEVTISQGPKKNLFSKISKLGKKKSEPLTKTVYDVITTHEQVEKEEWQASPLSGMKSARTIVKSSYLTQVVKFVVSKYLQHHTSPRLLSFPVVYKGLTDNETMDFFKENFNESIERRMQDCIEDALRSAGRLRVEKLEESDDENRYDQLDSMNHFENRMEDFEGYDSDSEEII